ncbi:MAG: hypothetical protein HXS42_11510 [Theionarchaea archaeon]|nr:hypothetical protein [Theionarchaea archaeon]
MTHQPDSSASKSTPSRAHKAIHYERQTQVVPKHTFDLTPFLENVKTWVEHAPVWRPDDIFVLRFVFLLPDREKTSHGTQRVNIRSIKEYEAAQTGLMFARSLIDGLVCGGYVYRGYAFRTGLQLGPSWREGNGVKTCAVLEFPCSAGCITADIFVFAAKALFSAEELNHMQAVTINLYFNDSILGTEDLPVRVRLPPPDAAIALYSLPQIQDILYDTMSSRHVLFTLKTPLGSMRQGMMVKTLSGWKNVEITCREELYTSVVEHGIAEFMPAVNRVDEDYPSSITIETDPGSMMEAVLGKRKSWILNTYVTEKILGILERYNLYYMVKFSGNKGWHIQIPVELKEPFTVYQDIVKTIVTRDTDSLSQEQGTAARDEILQLEEVKSYKDPFFVARRFVDLVGARVMFYELRDIGRILTLDDLKKLHVSVQPMKREDYLLKDLDIYETSRGPVKVGIPQILSINPYSRFRRQFKLLIDHSSNKREGKLRSVFSLHSKTGLVSLPALLQTTEGTPRFDPRMWDHDFVHTWARAERVYDKISTGILHPRDSIQPRKVNEQSGFEQFLRDNAGLLIYLLQEGGEALELLTTPAAVRANTHLWNPKSQ